MATSRSTDHGDLARLLLLGILGCWLLFPFLQRIGPAALQALKQRVAAELKTTFASRYAGEVSLADALQRDMIAAYARRATGEKFLLEPNRGRSLR